MSSSNMFALLNDDSSDDEAPQKQAAPAKAPAPAPARQERKNERKPRQPREDRAQRDNTPYDGSDKVRDPAADRERQGKGGNRGGKGKGKGGSRGDSGREYPRRSGTGRGRENSKSGGGKYNWGKEDGSNQINASADQPTDAEPAAEGAAAPAEAAEVVPEEEEEPTMSLEEYEMLEAEKNAVNLNKVSETRTVEVAEDVTVHKDDEVEDEYSCMFHAQAGRKKHPKKKGRAGAKQADQVLNLKFVDENDSRGKGKGRKGDGRKGGNGKGYNNQGKNIDLSNDASFPTLGA